VAGLDVDLWLVGSGPSREDLRRQAEACGARVRFLGTRRNAELPAILAECAAFVLPSRVEGHPKALIEAMACGRAVVGSDVPGIRDVIVPRETGLLCGTSPESIRAALRELLADAALRARLGAAARAWALAHVSLEGAVEAELDLLSELALELT
jgi:glycosyltransferase involved in cell wall biosynthesis